MGILTFEKLSHSAVDGEFSHKKSKKINTNSEAERD